MMVQFQSLQLNNKDPVYLQLALYVKQQILLGHAITGSKLPSRREIAAQLNINPNTVQKAFRYMEEAGYVKTTSTHGSTIYCDTTIFTQIETELTEELVANFVQSAQDVHLSVDKVVELIRKMWDTTTTTKNEEP
ncbi:GntR family transcriptional regulator [Paenibacillus yanchengensis]|uniref:GntR family transcriptional regulator n=1 Tax=Paenibacillus yanchengensis TaxID=2035833 RepID=A0ABW4YPH2_9BACL